MQQVGGFETFIQVVKSCGIIGPTRAQGEVVNLVIGVVVNLVLFFFCYNSSLI
jgi:hypothetical protein